LDDNALTEQHLMGLYAVAREEVTALATARQELKTLALNVSQQAGHGAKQAVADALKDVPASVNAVHQAAHEAQAALQRIDLGILAAAFAVGALCGLLFGLVLLNHLLSPKLDSLTLGQNAIYQAVVSSTSKPHVHRHR
jgi:hypothetical protein